MKALQSIADHVIFKFRYNQIYQMKTTMVTKLLDFIHKHLNYKVIKSFFDYLNRCFRNLAETDEKLQIFWRENREINFFFNFFIAKYSYIVSKPTLQMFWP